MGHTRMCVRVRVLVHSVFTYAHTGAGFRTEGDKRTADSIAYVCCGMVSTYPCNVSRCQGGIDAMAVLVMVIQMDYHDVHRPEHKEAREKEQHPNIFSHDAHSLPGFKAFTVQR